jgi:hypothetical protein
MNVIPGVPFATPRVRWTPSEVWMSFAHSNRLCWRMISGAVSGINETRKLAPAAAGRWFASLNKSNDEPSFQPARAQRHSNRFVRQPAGSHRASLPQAQHRLSR